MTTFSITGCRIETAPDGSVLSVNDATVSFVLRNGVEAVGLTSVADEGSGRVTLDDFNVMLDGRHLLDHPQTTIVEAFTLMRSGNSDIDALNFEIAGEAVTTDYLFSVGSNPLPSFGLPRDVEQFLETSDIQSLLADGAQTHSIDLMSLHKVGIDGFSSKESTAEDDAADQFRFVAHNDDNTTHDIPYAFELELEESDRTSIATDDLGEPDLPDCPFDDLGLTSADDGLG